MREATQIETRSVTARARAVTAMMQKNEETAAEVSLLAGRLQHCMQQVDLKIETNAVQGNVWSEKLWFHVSSNQAAIRQIQMEQAIFRMDQAMRKMEELQASAKNCTIGKDKPSVV